MERVSASAQNRAAQRMIGPEVRDEYFVDQIVGAYPRTILISSRTTLRSRFNSSSAKFGEVIRSREQIERAGQMLVEHLDVVAGDFAAGEGVDVTADGIAFNRDPRAMSALACALEECVFDEMRDAVERRRSRGESQSEPRLPTEADLTWFIRSLMIVRPLFRTVFSMGLACSLITHP